MMTTITKKQIVERIAAKTKQTKVLTKETVQLFLDTVTEELAKGNRIELRDFGVFEVKDRARRIGRNPRTGEPVPVPERRVVTFKVGRMMRKKVASNHELDDDDDFEDEHDLQRTAAGSGDGNSQPNVSSGFVGGGPGRVPGAGDDGVRRESEAGRPESMGG